MAFEFGFYNAINDDRFYEASDIGKYFSGFIPEGINQSYGDMFKCSPGSGMHVVIGAGRAEFGSIWIKNDSDYILDIGPDTRVHPENDTRMYKAVAIEVNTQTRSAEFVVLDSLELTSQEIDISFENGPIIYHYPLWKIHLGDGRAVTQVRLDMIIPYIGLHERTPIGYAIATPSAYVTTKWNSWQERFYAMFNALQNSLSGNISEKFATEVEALLNKVNTLEPRYNTLKQEVSDIIANKWFVVKYDTKGTYEYTLPVDIEGTATIIALGGCGGGGGGAGGCGGCGGAAGGGAVAFSMGSRYASHKNLARGGGGGGGGAGGAGGGCGNNGTFGKEMIKDLSCKKGDKFRMVVGAGGRGGNGSDGGVPGAGGLGEYFTSKPKPYLLRGMYGKTSMFVKQGDSGSPGEKSSVLKNDVLVCESAYGEAGSGGQPFRNGNGVAVDYDKIGAVDASSLGGLGCIVENNICDGFSGGAGGQVSFDISAPYVGTKGTYGITGTKGSFGETIAHNVYGSGGNGGKGGDGGTGKPHFSTIFKVIRQHNIVIFAKHNAHGGNGGDGGGGGGGGGGCCGGGIASLSSGFKFGSPGSGGSGGATGKNPARKANSGKAGSSKMIAQGTLEALSDDPAIQANVYGSGGNGGTGSYGDVGDAGEMGSDGCVAIMFKIKNILSQ